MREIKFSIDYTYCPKGHGDWIFIPSSILYSDVFWCEECGFFYEPSVKKLLSSDINKEYNSDRADELVKRADFIKWKNSLKQSDMDLITNSIKK